MERWGEFLKEIGYTSFIPALRQSTDFRISRTYCQDKDSIDLNQHLDYDLWRGYGPYFEKHVPLV